MKERNVKAILNTELNGIELYFDEKPEEDTRTALKENSFRWNRKKSTWYTKNTEDAQKFVKVFFNLDEISGAGIAAPAATKTIKKVSVSLWDRLNVDSIPKHSYKPLKEITAETRTHFKKVFPELKISCTTGKGGWASCNEIYFYVKSAPYSKEQHPEITEAIKKYIKSWLWSYNYDNSDSMTDYFDRGFYESIHVDYDETEPTAAQQEDIKNFYECLEEKKKADKEEEQRQFEEIRKEREEAEKEYKIRQEQEKKQAEEINKNVKIVDIEEDKKYLITGKMLSGIGKECNIMEFYLAENAEYISHETQTALIKREIYFTDKKAYDYFCNMFLYDFDFLSGCGGTGTYDNRVTSDNIHKLNKYQHATVNFILWDAVAVYLDNKLKLIIDPEGYNYARYVYIVDDEYIKEPVPAEDQEEKEEFYFPAPIAEQAANITPGEYTVIYIDPWILNASMQYIDIKNSYIANYAQYKNSFYYDYIQFGKYKKQTNQIHDGESFLLFPGYLPRIPEEMLYKKISENMQQLKFSGKNAYNFMIECAKYYKSIGYEPIINTLQY